MKQFIEFTENIGLKEYGYRNMSHKGSQQKRFYVKKNELYEYLKKKVCGELANDWYELKFNRKQYIPVI